MHKSARQSGDVRETARIEAFSDGVFAIAITLLILEIKVPRTPEVRLARALVAQWPSYAALVISFATISIRWINTANGRLLGDDVDRGAVAALTRSYAFGPLLYLIAFVAAFFNVALSLLITFALAVFFALPPRTKAHA